MPYLHLDVETHSECALEEAGGWRYASDPTTGIFCACYALDDAPVKTWVPADPIPDIVHEIAIDPDVRVVCHNVSFEFAIWQRILTPRYTWPSVPIEKFECTMAMARAIALPGALEKVAEVLRLSFQKDKDGARLMRDLAAGEADPTPENLARLYEYCRRDVEAERELHNTLPRLSDAERAVWLLDQRINARGIHMDVSLARAVDRVAHAAKYAVDAKIFALTDGKVETAHQRDRIITWVNAHA